MVDYDAGWTRWADMVKYSPAPFHRRRMILDLARDVATRSVLDVGCGTGELIRVLQSELKPDRIAGVDLSPAVIESNRRAMPFAEFHAADLSQTTIPGQWDLIVATEVVEHIAEYRAALKNLRAMCRGHIIITVPSGKIFPIDRHMGHVQHFAPEEMATELATAGFRVKTHWEWGFPWHTLYRHAINTSPEKMLERFGSREYSATDKFLSRAITMLFYFNLKKFGTQLVVLAEAVNA